MAETLYTIPINEAFEQTCICPFCALESKLYDQSLEYVLSPAMMEPDVRMEMNRLGFCNEHFLKLLTMKNRLSLALILESRLDEILPALAPVDEKRSLFGGSKSDISQGIFISEKIESCYVCSRVSCFMEKALSNAVHHWKTNDDFKEKFNARENICLPHTARLLIAAENELRGKHYSEFKSAALNCASKQGKQLRENLAAFTRSFDHRYANTPLTEDEKSAVQDVIRFLTGE